MKLLVFAASLRKESLNRKLAKIAGEVARSSGAAVTEIDLNDYPLPPLNTDLDESSPQLESRGKLAKLVTDHDGLILSSPEYNFSMPGHFKNTFDWLSKYRPMPWGGKQVLLLSASPSLVGGARGLWQMRIPFEGCGSFVFPEMFSLSQADQAFDAENKLKAAKLHENLSSLVKKFCKHVEHVRNAPK